jgi:hypothetical protein
MDNHVLFLITGYARAGKDTLAEGIKAGARQRDVFHLNYADLLKEASNEYLRAVNEFAPGVADFRKESFKVANRGFLVEAGRLARSINIDVFAEAFVERCIKIAAIDYKSHRKPCAFISSDWRYMNELSVAESILGQAGWKIITARIDTAGIGPANEEEGLSIGEITRNAYLHYQFTAAPNNADAIRRQGQTLAATLEI